MALNQTAKAAIDAEPAFVLLYSIHLESAFKGYGALRRGIATMSSKQTGNYLAWLAEFETRLLVKMFREAGCARATFGRVALDGTTVVNFLALLHSWFTSDGRLANRYWHQDN